jgi:hypothetical protein
MSFSGLNGLPRRLVGAKLAKAKTEALQSEDWSSWGHDVSFSGMGCQKQQASGTGL